MKQIDKLLVAMPIREEDKADLERRLPHTQICYSTYLKKDETEAFDADVIFGNVRPSYLAQAQQLRWVQLASSGADIYAPILPQETILTSATGAYGNTIAEHMLAMVLGAQKHLFHYRDQMKTKTWKLHGTVSSLFESTVLSIGMGNIGAEFLKRMHLLGAHTIGVRRKGTEKPEFVHELYWTEDLPRIISRADIIALSLPNTADTQNLINQDLLTRMKPGAILINVGRGSSIAQDDLVTALTEGTLGFACLDVTTPEPLPEDHPLWSLPNVLITPHSSGGFTHPDMAKRIYEIFCRNLDAYLSGAAMENIVDRSTGYRKL